MFGRPPSRASRGGRALCALAQGSTATEAPLSAKLRSFVPMTGVTYVKARCSCHVALRSKHNHAAACLTRRPSQHDKEVSFRTFQLRLECGRLGLSEYIRSPRRCT